MVIFGIFNYVIFLSVEIFRAYIPSRGAMWDMVLSVFGFSCDLNLHDSKISPTGIPYGSAFQFSHRPASFRAPPATCTASPRGRSQLESEGLPGSRTGPVKASAR